MKRTLLISVVILIWAAVGLISGAAQGSNTMKVPPAVPVTGETGSARAAEVPAVGAIEVHVKRGCNQQPPYNPGMKVRLNKMPEVDSLIGKWWSALEQFDEDSLSLLVQRIRTDISGTEIVALQRALDSLRIDRSFLYPLTFFDSLLVDTARTDSSGRCLFENVLVGYYQVVFQADHPTLRIPILPSSGGCRSNAVDFVRVAADSVSIVTVEPSYEYQTSTVMSTAWNVKWRPEYARRAGSNR